MYHVKFTPDADADLVITDKQRANKRMEHLAGIVGDRFHCSRFYFTFVRLSLVKNPDLDIMSGNFFFDAL